MVIRKISTCMHGVIFHKAGIFMVTTVKTQNLVRWSPISGVYPFLNIPTCRDVCAYVWIHIVHVLLNFSLSSEYYLISNFWCWHGRNISKNYFISGITLFLFIWKQWLTAAHNLHRRCCCLFQKRNSRLIMIWRNGKKIICIVAKTALYYLGRLKVLS